MVGVDFSEKLIRLAKKEEEKEKLGIRYCVLDASNLGEFSDGSFDLVTCFMALQDIEEYERAIGEVARVLRKRGRFVFSIPHPCFETLTVKGRRIRASEIYFETGSYPIHWDMKRLSNHFVTITFHRTLTDYFNALSKSGLFTARLVEPKPTEETLKKYPLLKDVKARPQSIIIESAKIHDL